MKKRLFIIIAALMVLMLAACGSSSQSSDQEGAEAAESEGSAAAEDAVHRVIGVQQLPRAVVLIYEEAARHVFAELFNDLEGLAVELKFFCEHGRFSSA